MMLKIPRRQARAFADDLLARGLARNGARPVLPNRVGNGGAVEHVPRRLSHLGEDPADLAGRLALAIGATPIGDAAEAGDGSNRDRQ